MEFEGLLLALIVGMAVYFLLNRSGQRYPGHRFGRQNPNQPYYGDDYDDYDNYPQPNYPQQYTGNQPIIIMPGGGYPYPPRRYQEESSLPFMLLIVVVLSVGVAVFHSDAFNKNVSESQTTGRQEQSEVEEKEQNVGLEIPEQEQPQKKRPFPAPPIKHISQSLSNANAYVLLLNDYSSMEGVRSLMDIYPKKKIVGMEINGVYWACVLTNSEDAAWDELGRWRRLDNDYRRYGLEPKIENLSDYCNELSWNDEGDMLICE